MSIVNTIGQHIGKLMSQENVSFRKLSEAIGVTHPTLAKYVEGSQPIDSDKLMRIALFFNKPFDYFFKNESEAIQFMFRADKPGQNLDSSHYNHLLETIQNYMDVIGDFDYQYIPPKYHLNGNEKKDALNDILSKIANEQRRAANIEEVIPENYFEVIENLGIHVIAKTIQNDKFFGASSSSPQKGSYIIINDADTISEERKIFSLIHEYGHLLFHSDQYVKLEYRDLSINGGRTDYEKIADKFAGFFLMPKNLVDSYVNRFERVDIYAMKRYFKVSLQTVYVMLFEYGHISAEQYRRFWQDTNYYGQKKEEPFPISKTDIEQKNSKIIEKIKGLYLNQEISISKISETLGLDTISTRQLLKQWRNLDERYLSLK